MLNINFFATREVGFSFRFLKYWLLSGVIGVGLSAFFEGFVISHLAVASFIGVMIGIITTTMEWYGINPIPEKITGPFDFLLKATVVAITVTIIGVVLSAVLYTIFFVLLINAVMLTSAIGIPL